MRNNIITSLMTEMEKDEKIFFLTADMGINLVEQIQHKFPTRFTNVGIAEQNMIGIAAGLANLGYKPFVYTISNFVIHRCFEQIRNDIILHKYPITLMGTSTGYDNAPLGPTHHIIDDWGCLRSFPGIDIYCPGSVTYANTLVSKIINNNRPAYIRIPKGEFKNPESSDDFVLIKGKTNKILLISYGSPAQECLKVIDENISVSVLVFNKLIPIDEVAISSIIKDYEDIYVIEDHFAANGLYSIICCLCIKYKIFINIESIAPLDYLFEVGTSSTYFHNKLGFTAKKIQEGIKNSVNK
jgi:transketolase